MKFLRKQKKDIRTLVAGSESAVVSSLTCVRVKVHEVKRCITRSFTANQCLRT